jgi:hypothetical protein
MEKPDNKTEDEIKKEIQRKYHKLYYHKVRKNKNRINYDIPVIIENKKNGRITVEF